MSEKKDIVLTFAEPLPHQQKTVYVHDEKYEINGFLGIAPNGLYSYVCHHIDAEKTNDELKPLTEQPVEDDWKLRLKGETLDLASKTNKLQDFMRTHNFYILPRADKDLLYDQLHAMLDYLQILGMRCELHQIKLEI